VILLASSLTLVILTLVKGVKVDENPLFQLSECFINMIILVDFLCRMRLQGIDKISKLGFYNILDATVVISCILLFGLLILSQSGHARILEEISEEIFLIVWSTFQTLRMVLIVKKQKIAQSSAKAVIEFDDEAAYTTLDISTSNDDEQEVIVFDMKKFEEKQSDFACSRTNTLHKRHKKSKRKSSSCEKYQDIEMQEFSRSSSKARFQGQGTCFSEDEEEDMVRVAVNHLPLNTSKL